MILLYIVQERTLWALLALVDLSIILSWEWRLQHLVLGTDLKSGYLRANLCPYLSKLSSISSSQHLSRCLIFHYYEIACRSDQIRSVPLPLEDNLCHSIHSCSILKGYCYRVSESMALLWTPAVVMTLMWPCLVLAEQSFLFYILLGSRLS
jgi:hypothetical protein